MSLSAQRFESKGLHVSRKSSKTYTQVTQEGFQIACDILQGRVYRKAIRAATEREAAKTITLDPSEKQSIGHGADYNYVLSEALRCLLGSGLVVVEDGVYHKPRRTRR